MPSRARFHAGGNIDRRCTSKASLGIWMMTDHSVLESEEHWGGEGKCE